ncbi:FmdB family zinc ribbon protein [Azospirillum isscasi]|uniref:Zinc ribbon domain-containing protein n=1 Tax=Azospirillum isscasi TaxID=3053926 RepID=A0ABU0WJK5_9PROT|nr:zinc ribbon domain-containing protein [Azospirillum isscasi]MDQ2103774.1 zinc ribbon domain-containing protein [Azospirillum isscasi]
MPLYSYHCTACNHDFEALVRSSDTPVCASCGSAALEKLVARIAPDTKADKFLKTARRAAASEGHFSNYSKAERSRI